MQFIRLTSQVTGGRFFDQKGIPAGIGWGALDVPGDIPPDAFALEIVGAGFLPLYRDGDLIIVSPSVPSKLGDRVLVKTRSGELTVRVLGLRTARTIEFYPLIPTKHEILTMPAANIEWVSRIIWARQ